MAVYQIDDWEEVKNIAYDVVDEQKGRGTAYEDTVAGTLGVKGQYMNWLQVGANQQLPLYEKVGEILDLWKDLKNEAIGNRHALIKCLEENQKAKGCSLLILKLKGASGSKSMQGSSSYHETTADMRQTTRSNSHDPPIQPQGNVTIQYGSGTVDNTNQGIGYVSGNGNQITMDSHDDKCINKRSAGIMACDDAKISENAINAGAIMGDVGTFSGNISGNKIGSSTGSIKHDEITSEKKLSKLQSTQNEMKDDEELKKELEDSKMIKLYPKFLKAGVNTAVLWDLDEEMLANFGLDKFEMLLYKKTKEKLFNYH